MINCENDNNLPSVTTTGEVPSHNHVWNKCYVIERKDKYYTEGGLYRVPAHKYTPSLNILQLLALPF